MSDDQPQTEGQPAEAQTEETNAPENTEATPETPVETETSPGEAPAEETAETAADAPAEEVETESEHDPLTEEVLQCREAIQEAADRVDALLDREDFVPDADSDEQKNQERMVHHVGLAYAHLEDAKMRLGKVVQYKQGGVSHNPR